MKQKRPLREETNVVSFLEKKALHNGVMVSFDIYDPRFTVIYFTLLMTIYCWCHHFRCGNCCSFAIKIGLLVQRTANNLH